MYRHIFISILLLLNAGWLATASVTAEEESDRAERVQFQWKEKNRTKVGRVLVEAQDGGILLLGRDGQLWNITPDNIASRTLIRDEFTPLTADEVGTELQAELGDGFEVVQTRHYVICTGEGVAYAEWCGGLFDRLFSAFQTHWRSREMKLSEPEFPLVAIIFADKQQFIEYAQRDVGPGMEDSQGYYAIRSNRIVLYDLTSGDDSPARTRADIQRKIAQSPFNVATVIHEATHQIAFNSGMHTRFADNPVWLTEGMAMYFETPDLKKRTGWRTVGRVNPRRLRQYRDYVKNRRTTDSLEKLVKNNERFAKSESAGDAYAEAWALSYFLIKSRRRQYTDYLQTISKKPPLIWDAPETRWQEFQDAFGDVERLQQDFDRFINRLR